MSILQYLSKEAQEQIKMLGGKERGHPIVIDRPKGYEKVFQTQKGPVTQKYPLDYGFFKGIINPEDKEEADVFLGSGGHLHGKYMKGKMDAGKWAPDEHKWYGRLSPQEHKDMMAFYGKDSKKLIKNHVQFKNLQELIADVKSHKVGEGFNTVTNS